MITCDARQVLIIVAVAAIIILAQLQEAIASPCRVPPYSWHSMIRKMGGWQTGALLRIYGVEGINCYIGDIGTSFGPFQLHYGGGLGDIFTKETGLNARNESTVPAQIRFMREWGSSHGGFSSNIWHGLRSRHHRAHHRHRWHRHH